MEALTLAEVDIGMRGETNGLSGGGRGILLFLIACHRRQGSFRRQRVQQVEWSIAGQRGFSVCTAGGAQRAVIGQQLCAPMQTREWPCVAAAAFSLRATLTGSARSET